MRTNNVHKKDMQGILAIRTRLGFSQEELAEVLQVSRSTLVMNERGERSLPGPALLKLSILEINLSGSAPPGFAKFARHPGESWPSGEFEAESKRILDREARCRAQSARLSEVLEAITASYKRTRGWLEMIDVSLESGRFSLEGEEDWWKVQRTIALAKLFKCDTRLQAGIRNRIATLQAEAAMCTAMQQQLLQEYETFFSITKKQTL